LSITFDDYHIRYESAPWPLSDVLVCGMSGAEAIPIVAFHGDDGFRKGVVPSCAVRQVSKALARFYPVGQISKSVSSPRAKKFPLPV
jgi:hypothetical protein